MNISPHKDAVVMQTAVLSSRHAQANSEKFEPGVQEVRTRFAHLKCELRHIQRGLMRGARKGRVAHLLAGHSSSTSFES